MPVRSSTTHPLRIDFIDAPRGGRIGMTFCPGKQQHHGMTGAWYRELDTDLEVIRQARATALVSLIEQHEFHELHVPKLGEKAGQFLTWLHLPIRDRSVPDAQWENRWDTVRGSLHAALDSGNTIVLHCMGGLGRTGLVAARLLVERGTPPHRAITQVRASRRGAIETDEQERYVRALVGSHPHQYA